MLTVRCIVPYRVRRIYLIVCIRLLTYGIDTYHAWAFSVVRLDDLGNARASTCGMGKGESHAFIFVEDRTIYKYNNPILGFDRNGDCSNSIWEKSLTI